MLSILIRGSDRAYTFLSKCFPGKVYKIKGFHLAYKNGAISKSKTVAFLLKSGPKDLLKNFHKYRELQKTFLPDIVISDFESFSYFFAKFYKLPLISIDNMQIINRCKLDIKIPESEKTNYRIAKNIVKYKVPRCSNYLISTFFNLPVIKKNTTLIPPILRDEIIKSKPSDGSHIIVYQTSSTQKNIIKILNEVSVDTFYVYGFNKSENHGNVILKPFSEEGFIKDLSTAKAVITNGGFSLISESVFLRKPICSIPIKNQFEQFLNASYIEKSGYGRHFNDFTSDEIKSFLYDLPKFRKSLKNYKQDSNNETLNQLDKLLIEL